MGTRFSASPGGKVRPGRAADHSPPSSAAVMEEYSYTSTHSQGHTGPVKGSLYLQKLPCPKSHLVLTERKPGDLLPAIKSLITPNMEREGEGIKENRYRDTTVLRVGPCSKTSKI